MAFNCSDCLKKYLLLFILFYSSCHLYAQQLAKDSSHQEDMYVQLSRGPHRMAFVPLATYTRRLKVLKTFSMYNICAGGTAVGGGIYLLASTKNSIDTRLDRTIGKLFLIGGSLAVVGGIFGRIHTRNRLHLLRDKIGLKVSTHEGKIIYRFN